MANKINPVRKFVGNFRPLSNRFRGFPGFTTIQGSLLSNGVETFRSAHRRGHRPSRVLVIFCLLLAVNAALPSSGLAAIKVEPATTVEVGEEVFLDGSGVTIPGAALLTNGMINGSYEWDFGDDYVMMKGIPYFASNNGGTSVSHFYTRAGTYTVSLNVTDINGLNKIETVSITVIGEDLKLPPRPSVDPILELKFENNLDDTSGNGLTAQWKNGTGSFARGIEGRAADLSSGSYIEVLDPNSILSGMDELTISLWARKKNPDVVGYMLDENGAYSMRLNFGSGKASLTGDITTQSSTAAVIKWPAYEVVDEAWHHYVITYNGSLVKLFIDGIENIYPKHAPKDLTGAVQTSANNLLIGKKFDVPEIFNGYIDEVKIYDKALTPEEAHIGFELWHADFHGHTAQYIYTQIPGEFTKDPANKIKATITGDNGYSKVIYQKNDLQSEEKVLLNNSELPAGNYTLTVQLLDSGNNLLDEIKEKFEKTYNGIPEVGINENNAIVVNGELFFPVTPWILGAGGISTWSSYINVLFGQPWDYKFEDWPNYLDSANANNLQVIGPAVFEQGSSLHRNANMNSLIEYVNTTKNHNALFMWAWKDEPVSVKGVSPTVVRSWTNKTHRLDSNHLVATTYELGAWIRGPLENVDYATWTLRRGGVDYKYNAKWFGGKRTNIVDVASVDWYPIAYQNLRTSDPPCTANIERVDGYALGLNRFIDENYNLVPVMTWVEACALGSFDPPTPAQLKMLIWLNIVHGAKGINWFHYGNPVPDENFVVMAEFSKHITILTPVVLGPETDRVITDNANQPGNRVDTMVREHEGNIYIFAVRLTEVPEASDPPITVTFNIGGVDAATATVFDEDRTIEVKSGALQDTFAPNAVHIYRIGASSSGNQAPILQTIGNKSVSENSALSFSVSATDADGDTITYSATGLPTEATFASPFTWTPDYSQAGSYEVTFIASDGQAQDSETITITVSNTNRAPVLEAIGDKSVNENSILSFSISASDADGDTITYSVGNLPTGATFGSQTLTWTPGYNQEGTYQVTFTASDGQAQDSKAITITVNNVNRAPVLSAIGNKSVYADSLLTFSVNATDSDGDAITYSANGLPTGATFTNQSFSWTPDQGQKGSYEVTFTASDSQLEDSEIITITVDGDTSAPSVTNLSPTTDSIQTATNTLVILHIVDTGKGVDANSATIKVNDNTVYTGNTTDYSSEYGRCRRTGTKADYTFVYQPDEAFDFDQTVTITANATDLAANAMDEYSYSFKSEMRSFGENKILSSGSSNDNWGPLTTVSDSSGNIWVAWPQGVVGSRDIYVGKLVAGTDSFVSSGVVQVTNDIPDQGNPVIAVDSSDKLYLAWQDNRYGEWDIFVSTSTDGINWSAQTKVTDPNSNQINPAIAIDSSDKVYIAWEDDQNSNKDIYIASSTNSFATKTISQITSNTYDQTTPAIAVDSDDTVYVVWTDQRNVGGGKIPKPQNDIFGAASNDSWVNIPIVTKEESQSNPAIATEAVGSVLHLVWLDDTNGDDDIYYASTSNGLPSSPLDGSSIIDDTTGTDQLSPVIITTGYTGNDLKVFACWRDERNADADLYFAETTAYGTNVFVGDDNTSSDQSEPAIGIDEYGQPYIVWINDRTDICYAGSTFAEPDALASENVSVSSGKTVGTEPAAISGVDDISIIVPAAAYCCDVKITISRVKNPQKLTLQRFSLPYEFGPSGINFDQSVTITIPYEVSSSGNSASAYWYNPLTGTLSQHGITDVEDIVISPSLRALRFKTTHFTQFLVGGGIAAAAAGGGGGGGCSISPNSQGTIVEFLLPYLGLTVVMIILKLRDARNRKARTIAKGKC